MKHYEEIAEDFEQRWFFDESYIPSFINLIYKDLEFGPSNSLLDLGCGTGLYAKGILEKSISEGLALKTPFLGVDLSSKMVERYTLNELFDGVCESVDKFISKTKKSFDRILVKEVVHHISDRVSFFKDIEKCLEVNGQALIITRPKNIEFPFPIKALEDFSKSQPDIEIIEEELKSSQVQYRIIRREIDILISKKRLFEMMKGRFMSCFSDYSDKVIDQGVVEVDTRYPEVTEISFKDKFYFIKIFK